MGLFQPDARYSDGDGGRLRPEPHFIVVHNIEHVRRALSAAAVLNCSVSLLSAPDAAGTIGAAVFRDMIRIGLQENNMSPAQVEAFIDCGNHAGHALQAIHEGCTHIKIDALPEVSTKLRQMLGSEGQVIDTSPRHSLDLGDTSISDEYLKAWLLTPVVSRSDQIDGIN